MKAKGLTRRDFLRLGVFAAAGTAAAACTQKETAPPAATATAQPAATATPRPTVTPEAGGVLNLSFGWGSYNGFSPVYLYGYSSSTAAMLTHSRLVDADHANVQHPALAERWEISEDATTYTYYLRNDAKWHDGEPVTAQDVEGTVKFNLTKETQIAPTYWIQYIKGGQAFYDSETDGLPGCEVLDDYTVQFTLEKPTAGWDSLALNDFQILPWHIFQDVKPEDIAEQWAPAWFTPELNIGSGPFKFVKAERDKFVELERFDDYWGGRPKLDGILLKTFGETDTTFIALEKGELDVMNLGTDYVERAEQIEDITLHTVNRSYIRVFLVHYEDPRLADKRIRQALMYAIDRKGLCDDLAQGLCIPYNSFMEPEAWLAPDLNDYEYNPDKAKQLLQEAGWDFEDTLNITYYYGDPFHRDWMAAIQQQLAQIGMKSEPLFLEGAAAVEASNACDMDIYFQGWGFGHPEKYGPVFTNGRGRCAQYWDDPEIKELFDRAGATADVDERREIYNEIQRRVNEELPILPMVKFLGVTAVNNRVSGFNEDSLWHMHHPWFTGYMNAENWGIKA